MTWPSEHFTLAQLVHSDTAQACGIDNTPLPEALDNLCRLAAGLDEVQRLLGHPLTLNSGYRCPALNVAVGGTENSQHCRGEAADFECAAFGTPLEIVEALAHSTIVFDQCILEYGRWVHLSFSAQPRRRVLTIYEDSKGYVEGLIDEKGCRRG